MKLWCLFLWAMLYLVSDLNAQPEAKLVPSDVEKVGEDLTVVRFGASVAVNGTYALVCAVGEAGGIYVYRREGNEWIEFDKIILSAGGYCSSIATDGDFAIVGASGDDEKGTNAGAAYVLRLQESGWVEVARLTAGDGAERDSFGTSVAIDGDYVVVGAPLASLIKIQAGAAYVFQLQEGEWIEVDKLMSGLAFDFDRFGTSVGISGAHIVVGTPGLDDQPGTAYIFQRQVSGWNEIDVVTSGEVRDLDSFGGAVAIDGDRMIVGDTFDNASGEFGGSAYIFEWQDEEWIRASKLLVDSTPNAMQRFGAAVSIRGDYALAGTYIEGAPTGKAFLFQRRSDNWKQIVELRPEQGEGFDLFGASLTLGGNYALIGAQSGTMFGEDPGSAYIYDLTPVAPGITSDPDSNALGGIPYLYDAEAVGFPTPEFFLDSPPAGMEVDPDSGWVTWTPGEEGDFDVVLIADNGVAPADTQRYVLHVGGVSPKINSNPPLFTALDSLYSYDVEAAGFPSPSFELLEGPTGMALHAETGLVEWIPTQLGGVDVVIQASNTVAPADTQRFTLTVGTIPEITSSPDTLADFGEPYNYTVEASGIPLPTLTLIAGPQGMTIDAVTRAIEWTPSKLEKVDVAVIASNGVAPADTQQFHINVIGIAPVITSVPDTTAMLELPYIYDVEATGAPRPVFALSIRPPGMVINPGTGLIEWTPTGAGRYDVLVSAVNGVVPASSQRFFITVAGRVNNEDEEGFPDTFEVHQNFPNPFASSTTIAYSLPGPGAVKIEVFDLLGRVVAVLVDELKPAGRHELVWEPGSRTPTGRYLLKFALPDGALHIVPVIKK